MSENKEKVYTLKSVKSEIEKLNKGMARKREKIDLLNAGIKSDRLRLKELEGIYTKLYNESLQRKIADVWLKEKKLSDGQISKFLDLSRKLGDKIDTLDVDTIVETISSISTDKKEKKLIHISTMKPKSQR